MTDNVILNFIFVGIMLIFSLTVHEFSHVLMARFLGDLTGKRMGRLTLDPLKHIDFFWTVMFPIIMLIISSVVPIPVFAAGKPAPYNPKFLKRNFFGNPLSRKTAVSLVAVSGPVSNLILAFLTAFIVSRNLNSDSSLLLHSFISLNISLFLFNLIPIPPLDGEKVLLAFLSKKATYYYIIFLNKFSWTLFILLIFLASGPLRYAVDIIHFRLLKILIWYI